MLSWYCFAKNKKLANRIAKAFRAQSFESWVESVDIPRRVGNNVQPDTLHTVFVKNPGMAYDDFRTICGKIFLEA